MKYLIDSLQSYETGHGDALSPIHKEADKSFMGDHVLLQPVTKEDFRVFSSCIVTALKDLSTGTHCSQPHHPSPIQPLGNHTTNLPFQNIPTHAAGDQSAQRPSRCTSPNHASEGPGPRPSKPLPIPGVAIPDLGKGKGAWRRALHQWNYGDPANGLQPLKTWPVHWYSGDMREKTGTKRSQRGLIAGEYER